MQKWKQIVSVTQYSIIFLRVIFVIIFATFWLVALEYNHSLGPYRTVIERKPIV